MISANKLTWLALFVVLAAGDSPAQQDPPPRVLFVGNSITYFNGLPYLFSEVARELYGQTTAVDFVLQPGGDLRGLSRNETAVEQLQQRRYDIVVLQERGGQLACVASVTERSRPDCRASVQAHRRVLELTGDDSRRVVLLGTYLPAGDESQATFDGERRVVRMLGIEHHIPVASLLREAELAYPTRDWRAADNLHPGPDLSLLMALAIADTLFERVPVAPGSVTVERPAELPNRSPSFRAIQSDLDVFRQDPQQYFSDEALTISRHLLNKVGSSP